MAQVEHFGLQQVERLVRDISTVSSCSKEDPRVAAYLHCAVNDEKYIADQLVEIQQHLEDRGWELACTYSDNGYSGNSPQRPGLLRLQQDVRDGRMGLVIVCDLARLFRNLSGLRRFTQLLRDHQVELACLR